MSTVNMQLAFMPQQIEFVGQSISNPTTGDDQIVIPKGKSALLTCRFALPRSATTGKGSTLESVAMNYNIVSGILASVVPALQSVSYQDATPAATATVPLNAASPAAALVAGAPSRPVSAVTTPAIDNQGATVTRSYQLSYTLTAAANADVLISGYSIEVNYNQAASADNSQNVTVSALDVTGTLTRAMIIGGIVTSSTAAAVVATTDTATNIVAGLPNAQVGDRVACYVINTGPNSFTVAAGAGVTLHMSNVAIAATTSRMLWFRIDNVGTPAVSVYA